MLRWLKERNILHRSAFLTWLTYSIPVAMKLKSGGRGFDDYYETLIAHISYNTNVVL